MKSFKALGLGAIALFTVIGCSGGDSGNATQSGTSTSTSTATEKKFKIGVSIPAADHGWTAGVSYWAEEAKKQFPDVEINIAAAPNPSEQIKGIDALKVKGMDALVVLATESAALTPKAKELHDSGTFIVNVDRGFTEPNLAHIYVAGDNKKFGKLSAEYVTQKMGGKGNLVIMTGIPCTVDTDRVESALAVFKASPGIKILDQQPGKWNQNEAYKVMQNMLTKHPQIDAIWAQDDDMAVGIEKALKEKGRDKNVWIFGGAGMKDIVKRVMEKDPMYPADITYPPKMILQGIEEAVKALKAGKKAADFPTTVVVDVPIEMITPENAKDFYFADSPY